MKRQPRMFEIKFRPLLVIDNRQRERKTKGERRK